MSETDIFSQRVLHKNRCVSAAILTLFDVQALFMPQIHDETGASIGTRGVWYPDRTKATAKDPPLYIHISASSKEMLQKAVDKVNELIALDMGSLVERGDKPRERVCHTAYFPHTRC